jgi:flagellar biosynthesis anti-sigma factor FlgM
MDIQNNLQGLGELLGVSAVKKTEVSDDTAANVVGSSSNADGAGDQASMSSTASLVTHAVSLPDVRPEKVFQVQQALADGSYDVDSSEVAAKMIDSMQGK